MCRNMTAHMHTGGTRIKLHSFLTSALGTGKWVVSYSGSFSPRVKMSFMHSGRVTDPQCSFAAWSLTCRRNTR